jgi:hypothetical protein
VDKQFRDVRYLLFGFGVARNLRFSERRFAGRVQAGVLLVRMIRGK